MRAIVFGCGRVGSGLADSLTLEGHQVVVVDRDPAAFSRLRSGFAGSTLVGVGFDRAVLERAGVEGADALAAVTGEDEANAVIARLAVHRFRIPRVVARMYDPRQASLYRKLGVVTISPVEWGISRLTELLTLRDVASVVSLGTGQVSVIEASISPQLAGRLAGEMEVGGEIRLVAITRGGRTFVPDPGTHLNSGDIAYLSVTSGAGSRLQKMLGTTMGGG